MLACEEPAARPLIERVEEFWDRRPCNVRHSPAPIGSREYFDQVEARKYRVEPHIPPFADFPRWAGKRVLEIGCGIGTDSVSFARAGAALTAVDLSGESLALARQRFQVYRLAARFHQANVEELSRAVPVEPYELVYSFGVLHHTPDPAAALRQIARYMTPESELRIMLYARGSWKALWVFLRHGYGRFWRWKALVREHAEAQAGCPVAYRYSKRAARRLLASSGFETLSIRREHIFPYEVGAYTRWEYRKAWYFRWMPRPLFRLAERLFGWHLLIRARLART